MKLVGDSKFIAEAYQKICEDDFMAGMGKYETEFRNNPVVFFTNVYNSRGMAGVNRILGPARFNEDVLDYVEESEQYTGEKVKAEVLKAINNGQAIEIEGEEGPIFIGPTYQSVEDIANSWIEDEATGDEDDITWDNQ